MKPRNILLACVACGSTVGLGIWAGQLTNGDTLFLTSLISSAVLITTAPSSRQGHPARIVLSHFIATASGIVTRGFLTPSPQAIAISVVIALSVILLLDVLHPPALANAGYAFMTDATTGELLALTAATAIVLSLASITISRVASEEAISRPSN
ncbi:MAG: HPP family protein [Rhodospirillaceae bacterium]|nr:MAG: HPP family protein [Rhodospirillaceae bacterium]